MPESVAPSDSASHHRRCAACGADLYGEDTTTGFHQYHSPDHGQILAYDGPVEWPELNRRICDGLHRGRWPEDAEYAALVARAEAARGYPITTGHEILNA